MRLTIVAAAVVTGIAAFVVAGGFVQAGGSYTAGSTGYDISYPQCSSQVPKGGAFGVVGVTNGLPWSTNPCLSGQYQWANGRVYAPAFYMNTANPGPISPHWNTGVQPRTCGDPAS